MTLLYYLDERVVRKIDMWSKLNLASQISGQFDVESHFLFAKVVEF